MKGASKQVPVLETHSCNMFDVHLLYAIKIVGSVMQNGSSFLCSWRVDFIHMDSKNCAENNECLCNGKICKDSEMRKI